MSLPFNYSDDYHNTLQIRDNFTCDKSEAYLNTPLISATGYNTNGPTLDHNVDFVIESASDLIITTRSSINGRYCLILAHNATYGDIAAISGFVSNGSVESEVGFNVHCSVNGTSWTDQNQSQYPQWYLMNSDSSSMNAAHVMNLTTNIPIFSHSDYQYAYDYLAAESSLTRLAALEHAINYVDAEFDIDETKTYFAYNHYGTFQVKDGAASGSANTWASLVFKANTRPAFYFDDNTFELKLVAPNVVSSYYLPSPGYIMDNVPETSYIEGPLQYSSPFYGDIERRVSACGELPENGSYSYGFYLSTNIVVFGSREDAEEAIRTGDYTKGENYDAITGGDYYNAPTIGDEETQTTFGAGPGVNPFAPVYLATSSNIQELANVFFTNDNTLLDNLKKGLEMYGSNPVDAIISLRVFPFPLGSLVNHSPYYDVSFGSYSHHFTSALERIISFKSAYIDAGAGHVSPIFGSYRDLSPFCSLEIYLPFIGWRPLNIEEFYNKTLSVRYYVDVVYGQMAAVILADNVMQTYFTGEAGMSLPVRSVDYAQFARDQIGNLLGAGASFLSIPTGGGLGAAAQTAGNLYNVMNHGAPMDHQTQKGNFSSGLGFYMPNNVLLKFNLKETKEPSKLNELYGKPSSASGQLGSFTGFLQCAVTRLNTSGMESDEIEEINSLLTGGIFI